MAGRLRPNIGQHLANSEPMLAVCAWAKFGQGHMLAGIGQNWPIWARLSAPRAALGQLRKNFWLTSELAVIEKDTWRRVASGSLQHLFAITELSLCQHRPLQGPRRHPTTRDPTASSSSAARCSMASSRCACVESSPCKGGKAWGEPPPHATHARKRGGDGTAMAAQHAAECAHTLETTTTHFSGVDKANLRGHKSSQQYGLRWRSTQRQSSYQCRPPCARAHPLAGCTSYCEEGELNTISAELKTMFGGGECAEPQTVALLIAAPHVCPRSPVHMAPHRRTAAHASARHLCKAALPSPPP